MRSLAFLFTLLLVCLSNARVYFEDRFINKNIDNWVKSEHGSGEVGDCIFAKPESECDDEDGGIKTSQDARYYHYSAKLDPFSNMGKNLSVQFSVKHEQNIDCGGGYIKLFGEGFDPKAFDGKTPYEIMFGPDICGYDKKVVEVIFSYKGKNHHLKKTIPCKTDTLTHLYTLIVTPNNTIEVWIDDELADSASLVDDYDMIPPKYIDDPNDPKPKNWIDDPQMDDPNDVEPLDRVKDKEIDDPNAKKPEDWDDDKDGVWTPPKIDNPHYKGEWKPRQIPNPAYKGEFKPRQILNPDYFEDNELYVRNLTHIGLDLWQVKSGTIFDNFLVSDDGNECKNRAEIWRRRFDCEEKLAEKPVEKTPTESPDTEQSENETEDIDDTRDEL